MVDISKDEVKVYSIDKLIGPLNDIETKNAPLLIYLKGNPNIVSSKRVSIIGTRNPSQKGKENAEKIAKYLIKNNVVIVSGLAKGIDSISHKTAIDNSGKTIAVIGTPLDNCYPKENSELQAEIAKNHLLISQFEIGSKVYPSNFPLRNRTMALISNASIIVEASEKSGTEHQGWEAIRLGRPLYIVKDLVENTDYDWIKKMITYGAIVLSMDHLEEIMDILSTPIDEGDLDVDF